MSYKIGMIVTLLFLFSARLGVAFSAAQNESDKPASVDTKHADENKTQPKKPKPGSAVPVHIQVSAQGMHKLPAGSTIEVKGKDPCKSLHLSQNIQNGDVMLPDLPVCKVELIIFITGFNAQTVSVDLGNYKDPMRISITPNGPPTVSWGPMT